MGPPPNIEGFRDMKGVITPAMAWGTEQYCKCEKLQSLIPFFKKHRNEPYYTSLHKRDACL